MWSRLLPQGARRSLAARLVAAAVIWSLVVLVIAGAALSALYRQSLIRQMDRELTAVIDALAATATVTPAGEVVIPDEPNDPRFDGTFSGRYWQVNAGGAPVVRSASLWDEALSWAGPAPGEAVAFAEAAGPDRQRLRIAAASLAIPQRDAPAVFLAAADLADAEADMQRFRLTLFAALLALAAGLIGAVVLQVRVGLAPLDALRADVAEIRRGKRDRLTGDYPTEVEPLTAELNKLLDHNREVVERARTHVGNLAHALKTPISVLLNEARAAPEGLGAVVERQAQAMARNVDHYLARAQAAARAGTLGARTPVEPVLAEITRTLERLYGDKKDIDMRIEVDRGDLAFRGERQDFEEMAANLVENACKYGGGLVCVRAREAGGALEILVEDDGPGLAPEAREVALQRGRRLDESEPGQGLGLSIVNELAGFYGGRLTLCEGAHGGLGVRLTLPLAD